MVKVTTLEGLELILENEFPCILNHPAEPKIELTPDQISGEMVTEVETNVEKVLHSTEKIDLNDNTAFHAQAMYNIRESAEYVFLELLKLEQIKFYAYNLA